MGTNYYAVDPPCPNPCKHCAQPAEWHIGKSMSTFQAHDESPWGPIDSWADWRRVLRDHCLTVRDEYGTEWDREEFIREVEAVPIPSRRRQFEWVRDHGRLDREDPPRDYLDADQFSFYRGEFS